MRWVTVRVFFERSGILHLGSKKGGGGHILTYLCGSLVGGAVMHSLGEGTGSGGGRLPTFSPTRLRYLNFVMSIKNVWELSCACVYCASFHNLVCSVYLQGGASRTFSLYLGGRVGTVVFARNGGTNASSNVRPRGFGDLQPHSLLIP